MAARFPEPRRWTELELEVARIDAVSDFVRRRAAEGSTAYRAAFVTAKAEVERLMDATSNLTTLDSGVAFLADPTLVNAARVPRRAAGLSGRPRSGGRGIAESDSDRCIGRDGNRAGGSNRFGCRSISMAECDTDTPAEAGRA